MPRLEQTVVILLSLVVTTSAWAQAPSPGASSTSSPIAAPQGQEGSAGSDNDALLARTAKLYYSTRTTGLTGFDCAVHPDWRTLFESSVKHSTVSEIRSERSHAQNRRYHPSRTAQRQVDR